MYSTQNLLDLYKQKAGVSSDNALSIRLGLSRQQVSGYRSGAHSLGDDRAIVIAEECGLDPGLVLVSMQAERAQKQAHTKTADILKSLFDRLSGATAAIILAAFLFTPETGNTKGIDQNDLSPANPHRMEYSKSQCHSVYFGIIGIMSTIRTRVIKHLAGLSAFCRCLLPHFSNATPIHIH